MADRFPGGVISKTPPTVVAPVDGEGGSASGVWTLDEVLGYQKAGAWPKGILPRELYAWGYNAAGALGDGTTVTRSSPVQIGSSTDWEYVSSGVAHSQAIKTNGTLWGWGNGGDGRFGQNSTISASSPVQIGALTNWAQTSSGSLHTNAVKTDNTLWSWGYNAAGQLGIGTVFTRSSPVQVGALTDWLRVSAGEKFCLAVKTDGTLWSWGDNVFGQLGDITASVVGGQNRSSPVQVGALTNWSQVGAGRYHSLAVKTDGTLWAWGGNDDGELGIGVTSSAERRSSPVQVGALTNWAQPTGGFYFSLATTTDGELYSWGRASLGRLGHNDVVDRSSPVQVGALTNWSQVSGGNAHTVAIKTDGTLWVWGLNDEGQLGDGTTIRRSSPVQIGAETNWVLSSAGVNFTTAVTRG